jgi:probable F420-dependent oxidoreductase
MFGNAVRSPLQFGMNIGRLGVWSVGLRQVDNPAAPAAASQLEEIGYGTIWYSAGSGVRGFEIGSRLLNATEAITVATGITSVWATTVEQADSWFSHLETQAPGRFLLGLGVSHAPMVDRGSERTYHRPLATMREYLDAISVPRNRRIVAALGPKMLALAAQESLGTHPYLITPAMTAELRVTLPPGAVIAVEQGAVVETDARRARGIARENLRSYLALPNYVNNWLRHGYQPADFTDGGSDRLVDDLVAWGDPAVIAERINAHYAAGADHVCVQVFGEDQVHFPVDHWRAIATETI